MFLLLFTSFFAFSTERLVSLNPALTETLFALGVGDQIVGTTDFSDFPEPAKKIYRVGSYAHPNKEKIVALRPTLVVAYKEGLDEISSFLKRAQTRVLILESRSIDDYPKIIEKLGTELKIPDRAQQLIGDWKKEWATLPKTQKTKKTAILLQTEPLIVAGGDTFLSEVVKRCGVKNIFKNLNGYPRIQREVLISRKRDFLLLLTETKSEFKVENSPSIWFLPNTLSILGPRLPAAARELCTELAKL